MNNPAEPKANGKDTIVISKNGTMIDGYKVLAKEKDGDQLKIMAEKQGVDGNEQKKALIRTIYLIGKTSFILRKEVKFEDDPNWITRNEFKLTR